MMHSERDGWSNEQYIWTIFIKRSGIAVGNDENGCIAWCLVYEWFGFSIGVGEGELGTYVVEREWACTHEGK